MEDKKRVYKTKETQAFQDWTELLPDALIIKNEMYCLFIDKIQQIQRYIRSIKNDLK